MRTVSVDNLAEAIMDELVMYHEVIDKGMKKVIDEKATEFVKNTKRDAPHGRRQKYYKNIAKKNKINTPHNYVDVWYVKDPEYRLTHLIIKGHAIKRGGRKLGETQGKDFITPNFNRMENELDKELREVIENGY